MQRWRTLLFNIVALSWPYFYKKPVETLEIKPAMGYTLFTFAAATRHLPVVEWLYHNGANLTAHDDYSRKALYSAASATDAGATKVIDFLVKNELSASGLDKVGMSPLHHVFDTYGEFETVSYDSDIPLAKVQRLIYHGADPTIQDEQGSTLLHLAAWHGHVGLVKSLIRQGVDVSVTNCEGHSPLDTTRDEDVEHLLTSRLR